MASFAQGLFLGLFLVLAFWLFIAALFVSAAVFAVLGPIGGVTVAILLLGLWFLTLRRILVRFTAAWKGAKIKSESSSP